MTRWYRLFRQTIARYQTAEPAIRDQLFEAAEKQGTEIDPETLTGMQTNRLFNVRYTWEVTPAPDAYVVLEKQYISPLWFGMAAVALLLGAITLIGAPPWNVVTLLGLFILLPGLIRPFFYTTPVDDTIAQNEDHKTVPSSLIVIGLAVLLAITTLYMAWIALTQSASVWPFTFLLAVTDMQFVLLYRHQTSLVDLDPTHLPHIYELIGTYLLLIQLGAIPASALIAMQSLFGSAPPPQSDGSVLTPVIAVVVLWVMYRLVTRHRTLSYHRFHQGGETIERPSRRILVLLLLGMAAYGLLIILVWVLQLHSNVVGLDNPVSTSIVAVSVLPLCYIPAGVFLQTVTFSRETIRLFRSSTPATIKTPVEINPRLRLLETDRSLVGSYSLGFRDYIFVSTAVMDELSPEELGAVLAHEEGHVKNRDALLSVVIPIVALFLLTGKNVVYTAFDFRTREFVADRYAVEKVGEDTLKTALQTSASTQDTGNMIQTWFSVAPTFISFSRDTETKVLDRFFGAFFGNFALTAAHPTTDERIAHIERGNV